MQIYRSSLLSTKKKLVDKRYPSSILIASYEGVGIRYALLLIRGGINKRAQRCYISLICPPEYKGSW